MKAIMQGDAAHPPQMGCTMSIVFNLLLFTHLVALVVGAATNVVMPILVGRAATAGPEGKSLIGAVAGTMSKNSRRALLTLVGTGLAMVAIVVWQGRVSSPSPWFIAKIVLVVMILGLLLARSVPALKNVNPATFGLLTRIVLLAIIFCSVMAFN